MRVDGRTNYPQISKAFIQLSDIVFQDGGGATGGKITCQKFLTSEGKSL